MSMPELGRGGCGDPDCGVSTSFWDEGLTFGSGSLDDYGHWEHPCESCRRAWIAQKTPYPVSDAETTP